MIVMSVVVVVMALGDWRTSSVAATEWMDVSGLHVSTLSVRRGGLVSPRGRWHLNPAARLTLRGHELFDLSVALVGPV